VAVKTLKSKYSPKDLTVWGMTLKVVREEGGFRALYRGLITTAVGVAPYVGINFAAYEALRGYMTPPGKATVGRKLSCGALAGERVNRENCANQGLTARAGRSFCRVGFTDADVSV
jgi:solute carrier family 25 phosphate transporter 23/24/25/41